MTDITNPHIALHIHTTRCTCGATSVHSEVYLSETFSGRRRLTPLASLPPELETVPTLLSERRVPICHACITSRPQNSAEVLASWAQSVARKRAEAATPTPPSAKRETTLEDLA